VAVVMTHSYEQDKSWLRLLLPAGLRLISQIGPKARTRRLIEELRAEGLELTPEQLSSLQFPAGLDLGAETPTEVALSIISGIQAKLTRHAGGFLSERDGPIHQLPQR
jgi:xanthine/CO dehydrogenase XdhC/CoxF family maturation factor